MTAYIKGLSKPVILSIVLTMIFSVSLAKENKLEPSNSFCKFVDSKFYNIERMNSSPSEYIIPGTQVTIITSWCCNNHQIEGCPKGNLLVKFPHPT